MTTTRVLDMAEALVVQTILVDGTVVDERTIWKSEAAEQCRCYHRMDDHTGADGECASPTQRFGDYEQPWACECEWFRYPDSDD
jgi:hypothetical protein